MGDAATIDKFCCGTYRNSVCGDLSIIVESVGVWAKWQLRISVTCLFFVALEIGELNLSWARGGGIHPTLAIIAGSHFLKYAPNSGYLGKSRLAGCSRVGLFSFYCND